MTGGRFEGQADAVKGRVDIVAIVGTRVALKSMGGSHLGLCPFHDEKTPSFRVDPRRGTWRCYGRCATGGDVIDFVMRSEGWTFADALRNLASDAGMDLADPVATAEAAERQRRAEERRRIEGAERDARRAADAMMTWRSARRDLHAGPAAAYLEGRGIRRPDLPAASVTAADGRRSAWPPTLRWIKSLKYREFGDPQDGTFWPVMVAALQRYNPDTGQAPVVAVHRTYLAKDGSGKAPIGVKKKVLGPWPGTAIRFTPAGRRLGLAEGIETALSVLMAGSAELDAVWAAGTLSLLDRVVIPPGVEEITLLMDNDAKNPRDLERTLNRACERYRDELGLVVRVAWPPKGQDFNDVLREAG